VWEEVYSFAWFCVPICDLICSFSESREEEKVSPFGFIVTFVVFIIGMAAIRGGKFNGKDLLSTIEPCLN